MRAIAAIIQRDATRWCLNCRSSIRPLYITKYWDTINFEQWQKADGLGIIIALLTLVAMFFIPDLLDVPDSDRLEATYCIVIVGLAAAFQTLFSPFAAVFVAEQRFDLLNLIAIAMRLTSAALAIICLYMGFGLPGLAAAAAVSTVGGSLLRAAVAKRILPSLSLSRQLVNAKKLRGIGSFGLWNFLISMTDYVYLSLLPILVAVFMPVAAANSDKRNPSWK